MPATTSEPKTKKPPKLFSVTGDANGIKTTLSEYARRKLSEASEILIILSGCEGQFLTAESISKALDSFIVNPTAKPKQP